MREHKRILAVDLGSKRVGLAVTDPLGLTVQALAPIPAGDRARMMRELQAVVEEKGAEVIVVGLPKNIDGSLGPKALECRAMGEDIARACGKPVAFQDEAYTSKAADEILIRDLNLSRKKRKAARDSLAACLILESYLSPRGS